MESKNTKKIQYDNGDIYVGEIDTKTQKRHGYGAYIWNSGGYYEGEFVQGNRTGKGIYIWPDRTYYVGDFVEGKQTGIGKRYNPNNWKFASGKFIDGKPESGFKENFDYDSPDIKNDLHKYFKSQLLALETIKEFLKEVIKEIPEIDNEKESEVLLKKIKCDLDWNLSTTYKISDYFGSNYLSISQPQLGVKINLESVFSFLAPKTVNELTESELKIAIADDIRSQLSSGKEFVMDALKIFLRSRKELPLIEYRDSVDVEKLYKTFHNFICSSLYFSVKNESFYDDIKIILMGLGLIEQSIKKRSVHDKETYWKLTEKGNKMMVDLKMKKLI